MPDLTPEQEQLIQDHLTFMDNGVAKYLRQGAGRYDRDDLRSAAYLGLVKAARAFDPSRGLKFTTFAYWKINGALMHVHDESLHAKGYAWNPNTREQKANLEEGRSRWQMRQKVKIQAWPTDEEGEQLDLPSPVAVDPVQRIEQQQRRALVLAAVTDERARRVLSRRMDGATLQVIANELQVSREYVRQIEEGALVTAQVALRTTHPELFDS